MGKTAVARWVKLVEGHCVIDEDAVVILGERQCKLAFRLDGSRRAQR